VTESKYEIDEKLRRWIIKINYLRIFYKEAKNKSRSLKDKDLML